jgi:two-component system, NtrC family, nitrogen regulation response regulator NtrX
LPRKAHLLLVDDDPNTLASLSRAFRLAGHEATVCDNAPRALDLLRTEAFDLILSDVVMPGESGLELLEDLKQAGVKTPIVLISGQANVEMAVKATKLGALDFLEKPLSTEKLLVTVENALRLSRLEDENRELRHRLGKHELVGSSPAMKKLLAQIDRVAASETRVCILGETGTGKELVARAIHEKSPRHENAFITLNCAAVSATKKERSRERRRSMSASSNKRKAARCFLTKLATCPSRCRRNCCVYSKKAKWNAWAATSPFA